MNKVDELKDFINKGKIFDLVIQRDNLSNMEVGSHHSVDIDIIGDKLFLRNLGFQATLTEESIEEVTNKTARATFIDEDKRYITLQIIDRYADRKAP